LNLVSGPPVLSLPPRLRDEHLGSRRRRHVRAAATEAYPHCYRMLGSVADAEDVVQDAFLRWLGIDRTTIREPEAFLRRVVTRLCLDQLKSARHRRETYIGPWLPDPVVERRVG
jgi:DNA-directed RNA polymerase specialized sigma24 family protein